MWITNGFVRPAGVRMALVSCQTVLAVINSEDECIQICCCGICDLILLTCEVMVFKAPGLSADLKCFFETF